MEISRISILKLFGVISSTRYCECDYLSMLRLKLIHVSKNGPNAYVIILLDHFTGIVVILLSLQFQWSIGANKLHESNI